MADIIGLPVPLAFPERTRLSSKRGPAAKPAAAHGAASSCAETVPTEPAYDLIELFFFAYRDFVGDADRVLDAYDFGRAHHRVLHFVTRQPGMTVADLLDILRITKQSLGRVMKELIDGGCIETRPGVTDRRQRLLFPTAKGRRLALDLAAVQSQRFERVFAGLPADAREGALQFLLAMVEPDSREAVRARLGPGILLPRLVVAAGRTP